MARSTAGSVKRAMGMRYCRHRDFSAAIPCPACSRKSLVPVGNRIASGAISGPKYAFEPHQATSWPRALSASATATARYAWPASGSVTIRNRLIGVPVRSSEAPGDVGGHVGHGQPDDLVDVERGDVPGQVHRGPVPVTQQFAEGRQVEAVEPEVALGAGRGAD